MISVPITTGRLFNLFDLAVDAFAQGVCHTVDEVSQDVLKMSLQGFRCFNHGFEPRVCCPPVPLAEELPRFIARRAVPEVSQVFLDAPGTPHFQVFLLQLFKLRAAPFRYFLFVGKPQPLGVLEPVQAAVR